MKLFGPVIPPAKVEVAAVEVAVKYDERTLPVTTASPAIDSFLYGDVVPKPRLPVSTLSLITSLVPEDWKSPPLFHVYLADTLLGIANCISAEFSPQTYLEPAPPS